MKPLLFSEAFMKKNMSELKLCITGGSGFIGTTAMSWATSKYKVINFDIRPPKILEYQKFIKKNCKYVGEDFAYEARSIHYDKKKTKAIYGKATSAEINELKEEGIQTITIPWIKETEN